MVVARAKQLGNGKKTGAVEVPKDVDKLAWPYEVAQPYSVDFEVEGDAPILFHRWNPEVAEAKSKSPKGSKLRKTDNPEDMVTRNAAGELSIGSECFRLGLSEQAKRIPDPSGGRGTAAKLFKAAIIPQQELCTFGRDDWDYLDSRRSRVQMSSVTRVRPALMAGWRTSCLVSVATPEYIGADMLNYALVQMGRLGGLGDHRPIFGRFHVTRFEVVEV